MSGLVERYHVSPGVTLFLRHRVWWADIHLNGSRWKRNLHTQDHQEALKRVVQIAGAPGTERRVLWTEATKTYFAEHSPLYHAPQSKSKAGYILGEFARFMERGASEGSLALDAVTRSRIEDWLRDLAPRISPCSCNCKLRTLRAFLRWTVGKAWIPADPYAGIRRLREIRRDD